MHAGKRWSRSSRNDKSPSSPLGLIITFLFVVAAFVIFRADSVSTARHADRILVLDKGRVAELGTHAELLAKAGIYASFARVQGRREALKQVLEGRETPVVAE